jgi:hypothetical protein
MRHDFMTRPLFDGFAKSQFVMAKKKIQDQGVANIEE